MVSTVKKAFEEFLVHSINLDPYQTKLAIKSRNWLIGRIHDFEDKYDDFPKLCPEKDVLFGSFARKTKRRPLDDVDLMICLESEGTCCKKSADKIDILVSDKAANLKKLCFDGTNILNSRRVINLFIAKLKNISQYEKADTQRNQEAAVLRLKSYEWNYDIVPCFFIEEADYESSYYIIPDGKGTWKKTDPRIDRRRVTSVNQNHSGKILKLIRIIKFWNKRTTMPSISSYLLENIILDYYEKYKKDQVASCTDQEIPYIFLYLYKNIWSSVNDPKGIQGNLNNLTDEEKKKISSRSYSDYKKAMMALDFRSDGDRKKCIKKWGEIFGPDFPEYGE